MIEMKRSLGDFVAKETFATRKMLILEFALVGAIWFKIYKDQINF
jgi:hypothetical protein